jgi:tetratricopeptide (TPR) repeat protein
LLCSVTAHADPQGKDDGCLGDAECKGRYEQAVALFDAGRFDAALPEFQAAYQRRQMPWLLINIGRTLHRLGRPREALDYYARFSAAEPRPDAETKERLEKYVAQAKALAESSKESGAIASSPPAEKPAEGSQPIYKKWWFWTAIGGGVVAVVAIGVGAGVAASRRSASLPSDVQQVMFVF